VTRKLIRPPGRLAELAAPSRSRWTSGASSTSPKPRRRLGHASTETTQIYTLLADKIADDRRRDTRRW